MSMAMVRLPITTVRKDDHERQNQGVVIGDKRFMLRAFNVNGEDESVLDMNELKQLMEQTSLHSPDNVRKRAHRELKPFEWIKANVSSLREFPEIWDLLT